MGSMFAAPFAKVVIDARRTIAEAGVFDDRPEANGAASPSTQTDFGADPPGKAGASAEPAG
jgi:hypothetical protein